jgi:hypothetical protein
VAETAHLSSNDMRVQWRFDLDLSLLPRPFQLGMANEPDWSISVRQSMDVPQGITETEQDHSQTAPVAQDAHAGEKPLLAQPAEAAR